MLHILWVGVGGFLGAILRYGLVALVHRSSEIVLFPYGILVANVVGSFFIGFLAVWSDGQELMPAEARAFIFIGLLGSFTTFSTFANETLSLLRDDKQLFALLNIVLHFTLCIGAVVAGHFVCSLAWR